MVHLIAAATVGAPPLALTDEAPTAGRITVAAGTAAAGPPTQIRRTPPGTIAIVAQDPTSTLDPLWAIGRSWPNRCGPPVWPTPTPPGEPEKHSPPADR